MSIFTDTIGNLRGHSLAMYSTWLYHKPTRVLFDAGEGVATSMRNLIFGVEQVFLSHGHYDHIGGLAGLIFSRASCPNPEFRGGNENRQTLTVHYPKGCREVNALRRYVEGTISHIGDKLVWKELEPGDTVTVGNHRTVEAFKVDHSSGLCLGYKLVEKRVSLKVDQDVIKRLTSGGVILGMVEKWVKDNDYQGALDAMDKADRNRFLKRKGKELVVAEKKALGYEETHVRIMLAYCGDSAPVRAASVAGAELLLHEATFLDAEVRRGKAHSTVAEALDAADYAGVKSLVLIHVSGRYMRDEILNQVQKAARDVGWNKPLAVMVGNRIVEIQ